MRLSQICCTALGATALLLALLSPPVFAQEGAREKRVRTLIESQREAKKKLERLMKKIDAVAQKLEAKGDRYHAEKLREAKNKIINLNVPGEMDNVIKFFERGQIFSATDEQSEILKHLRTVIDILLDRKSFEELTKQIDELRKQGQELEKLIEREKQHEKDLEKLAKQAREEMPEDVKKHLDELAELKAKERRLLERTHDADIEKDLRAIADTLARAADLLGKQKDLLKRTQAVEGLTRREEKSLREALEDLKTVEKDQQRLTDANAGREETQKELAALSEGLSRAASEQAAVAGRTDEKMSTKQAAGLEKTAGEIEKLLRSQEGLRGLLDAVERIRSLHSEQTRLRDSTSDPAQMKDQLQRIQNKAFKKGIDTANLLRKMAAAGEGKAKGALSEAAEHVEKAAEHMHRSGKSVSRDAFDKMKETMGKAGEELKSALDRVRPLTGDSKNPASKIAKEQNALASQASELARRLASMGPDEGGGPEADREKKKAADSVNRAANRMEEAASRMDGRDFRAGIGKQKDAEGQLAIALDALRKMIEEKRKPGPDLVGEQQLLAGRAHRAAQELASRASREAGAGEGPVGSKLREASKKAAEASKKLKDAVAAMKAGKRTGTGEAQSRGRGLIDEAKKLLDEARRRKEAGADRALSADLQKKAAARAEAAAEKIRKTAGAVEKRKAPQKAAALNDVAGQASRAGGAMKDAAGKLKEGASPRAAEDQKRGLEEVRKAVEGLRKFLENARPDTKALGKEQSGLGRKTADLAREAAKLGGRSRSSSRLGASKAAGNFGSASSRMKEAESELKKGGPREAEKDQTRAAEELAKGIENLKDLQKRLRERSAPDAEEIAQEQKRLAERAKKLAEKLKEDAEKASAKSKAGGGGMSKEAQSLGKASSHTQSASGKMKDASGKVQKRDFQKSRQDQKKALEDLEKAEKELREMSKEALRKKIERELKKLVKQQKETEEKTSLTKEELERLRKLIESRMADSAQKNMKQAGHKVSKMDFVPAKEKMEKARKYLEKARDHIQEEEREYQNLAQEQLIFLIKTELKRILEAQEKVNEECEKMGVKVDQGRRLRRSEIRLLQKQGVRQGELAGEIKNIEDKIKNQAHVFTYVIQSVGEDMLTIQELLASYPPDVSTFTRGMQKEVVIRLRELIGAFKLELKRRQQSKPKGGGKKGQGGRPGRPRLVDPLAEIQMLKFMETALHKRTQSMKRRIESGKELSPVHRKILERLTHEQGDIHEVLKKFIEAFTRETEGSRR
jgi:hypothetical protein